jgi:dTMP kinase
LNPTPNTRGRFITFEGIDGAGKSTQIGLLEESLHSHNIKTVTTREPGGTVLGEELREILLNKDMHVDTEALLMFASRREHLATVIEPALRDGAWVLCDRFSDATYAYQVGGRGLDAERCNALENWVHPHLKPDITFLFDLPPTLAEARRIVASLRPGGCVAQDRFEREQRTFFEGVRAAYLERARRESDRFHIIDATSSQERIARKITAVLNERGWW